ncbi:hypothetical protein Tco_0889736, partial [Tanacetum coccineum]
SIISSASSAVTYTSVYTDSEPERVFWGADEELSDRGSPRVIVYGYDGLPMQPVAPPSHYYVPGPEHPPSPVKVPYVPEPEYPEYLVMWQTPIWMRFRRRTPRRIMLTTRLMEGMLMMSPLDDDDDTNDEDEEPFEDENDDEEEEDHLASADSSVISVVDPVPSAGDTEAFETDKTAPTHIPSPPLPPPPSSLYLPPPVPTSSPLPSPPLPPLPALLFIPSPVDRRENNLEAKLPPCKRLCLTVPTSRYEVGESSTAAPRPTGDHRADYRFIGTMDAEIRRQRAEEVGYGIRDVWVDPIEAVEEIAPMTLKGVNARVTEHTAVQEQDTQDVYAVIEDAQDRQTQLSQRVDVLVEDRRFHNETARLLDQEALVSSVQGQLLATLGQVQALQARDQTHADDREGATSTAVGLVFSFLVSDNHNNMPQRRSSAIARAAAAAVVVAPMTTAAVEQLIKARVGTVRTPRECTYKDFLNCKPLSFKGTEGVVVLSQWFEKMESVFHISKCAVENQNNMPPRRSSATARAAAAAVVVAPMTTAAVEQLIKARVSATLANQ